MRVGADIEPEGGGDSIAVGAEVWVEELVYIVMGLGAWVEELVYIVVKREVGGICLSGGGRSRGMEGGEIYTC